MIETYQQLLDSIEEIQKRTGWTHHRIALKASVSPSILYKLVRGESTNPHRATMKEVGDLLKRVRKDFPKRVAKKRKRS